VGEKRAVVRSYQRLFVPDRRIYAIDGRTIPVPGGVPLRWLGAYVAAVAVVLVVGGRSPAVVATAAALAYGSAARLGRRREGVLWAGATAAGLVVSGAMVDTLDWPLRLVVGPALAASALTQLAPDGRRVPRYLVSVLRVAAAGRRRLGVALPEAGRRRSFAPRVVVVCDRHRPVLGWARITGPCVVRFAEPMLVGRRGRLRPVACEPRRLGVMVDSLRLGRGERVEVRP
jgi:hypothetical protein